MAGVVYEHVTKQFGEVKAVNDLSLDIQDKEFLVLVGPSGCGKTTALRLLAGFEETTTGVIKIGERIVNDVAPKDRDIAMVFQSYALYPHMSVYDNMAFGLKLRKKSKAEIDNRVKEAANILGIDALLTRKPRQLSGGQRQRVALGRAIVREPKVFLMDEPLSNLDAKLRVQTRTEISKLHKRLEATFIYVTHDQTEAMTMGTRIAVMKDGILHQLDAPQNIYDYPTNMFVASFIGSPAMNFFDAIVTGRGEDLWLDTGAFKLPVPADTRAKAAEYAGKPVVIGVRPEDFHDQDYVPGNINSAPVNATVDVIEPMGAEIYLYLMSGKFSYVARVDPRSQGRPGKEMGIMINLDHLHIFDKQTEKAIR
jgi:multiple sugar transport system ATP-binding protein